MRDEYKYAEHRIMNGVPVECQKTTASMPSSLTMTRIRRALQQVQQPGCGDAALGRMAKYASTIEAVLGDDFGSCKDCRDSRVALSVEREELVEMRSILESRERCIDEKLRRLRLNNWTVRDGDVTERTRAKRSASETDYLRQMLGDGLLTREEIGR